MRDGPRELDDRLTGALALPPVLVEAELQTEREGAGERAVNHLSIISPSPSRSGGDDEDDALVDPLAALGRGRTAVQN